MFLQQRCGHFVKSVQFAKLPNSVLLLLPLEGKPYSGRCTFFGCAVDAAPAVEGKLLGHIHLFVAVLLLQGA
jgi:hypothetical protein